MTADEWGRCPRSDWMLMALHEWLSANRASAGRFDRKLRLYAVACCRQRCYLFETDLFHRALDASERLADGQADKQELIFIYDEIMAFATPDAQGHCIESMTLKLVRESGKQCAFAVVSDLGVATGWDDFESVVQAQAHVLRCVVGNPFRPVAFDPLWRTSAVLQIARSIYAGRDFDRMPTLADALEEAACDHPGIIAHCRDDAPHARGCWVIDRLLEKA